MKHKTFNEYKSEQEEFELFFKFDEICDRIENSGTEFEKFWLEAGMPTLMKENINTPEEALDGMLEAFWNPFSWGKGKQEPTNDREISPYNASDKDVARRRKAANIVIPVKQKFAKAIENFKREIQSQAMNNPNQHHTWQAANLLANAANRWLKQWFPKVNRSETGGPNYAKDYQQAYQDYQSKTRRGELSRQQNRRSQMNRDRMGTSSYNPYEDYGSYSADVSAAG